MHSRWYWDLKLYLITTPDGMPVAWCLASPKIGECEVAAALLAHAARAGSLWPGLTLIGDKGFAGSGFEDLAATGGITHLGACPSESVQLSPGCGPVPSALTRALRDATW